MSPHHFYCHRSFWVNKAVLVTQTQTREGLSLSLSLSLRGPGAGPGQFFSYPHLWVLTTIMAPTQPFVPLSQETVIRKLNKDMEKPKIYGEVPMYKAFPHWIESTILTQPLVWAGLGRLRVSDNPGKCFARDEMCPISAEMRAMTRTGPAPATQMIDRE